MRITYIDNFDVRAIKFVDGLVVFLMILYSVLIILNRLFREPGLVLRKTS